MPTADQIKSAANRREQRKLARESAVEEAHRQTATLSETLAANKNAPAKPAPAPRMSAKERRAAERKAAEEQALRDTQVTTHKDVDHTPFLRSRAPVPLHVLNAASRQGRMTVKDDAREIATAAGKAAFEVAVGKRPAKKADPYKRMRDAQDAKAKLKAEGGK